MKKLLLYIVLVLVFIFLPPLILTNSFFIPDSRVSGLISENTNNNIILDKAPYNYTGLEIINLLDSNTGEVVCLDLDEYLLGVVSAEMPANFELEALKAQAVVARTYTIHTISENKHGKDTICNSPSCCQAWISKEDRMSKWDEKEAEGNWNKIEEAVYSTKGQVITYNGEIIDAFFHANSGGITETPENVWGGETPYLKSVQTSGEENYKQYSSSNSFSKKELEEIMLSKYEDFLIDWDNPDCICITEYTENGRIRFISIGNKAISGVEARSMFGLKSTNFEVKIDENEVTFSVTGYGHGVGMSQTGADSMAKGGANYVDIIKHFYTGVEVISI